MGGRRLEARRSFTRLYHLAHKTPRGFSTGEVIPAHRPPPFSHHEISPPDPPRHRRLRRAGESFAQRLLRGRHALLAPDRPEKRHARARREGRGIRAAHREGQCDERALRRRARRADDGQLFRERREARPRGRADAAECARAGHKGAPALAARSRAERGDHYGMAARGLHLESRRAARWLLAEPTLPRANRRLRSTHPHRRRDRDGGQGRHARLRAAARGRSRRGMHKPTRLGRRGGQRLRQRRDRAGGRARLESVQVGGKISRALAVVRLRGREARRANGRKGNRGAQWKNRERNRAAQTHRQLLRVRARGGSLCGALEGGAPHFVGGFVGDSTHLAALPEGRGEARLPRTFRRLLRRARADAPEISAPRLRLDALVSRDEVAVFPKRKKTRLSTGTTRISTSPRATAWRSTSCFTAGRRG